MTVTPVSSTSSPPDTRPPQSRVARWAVKIASACATAFTASIAAVALAYASERESAVEDTWLGALLVIVPAVAIVGSLASFILAILAKVRHERWAWLWLPLGAFPAMVAFVAFAEAFLME